MADKAFSNDREAALYWRLRARWLRQDAEAIVGDEHRKALLLERAAYAEVKSREFEK